MCMTLVCDLSVILVFSCHAPVLLTYNSHWIQEACKTIFCLERDCISAYLEMFFETNKKEAKGKKKSAAKI